MIAFVAFLCIGFAYYIERQINDPGVAIYPFNSISQCNTEVSSPVAEKESEA